MGSAQANIRVAGIEVLYKHIKEKPSENAVPPVDFHYDIAAMSQVNPSVKFIIIRVDIKAKEVESGVEYLSIGTLCVFKVENFHEIIEKISDTNYLIPPDIDATLKSVAVSTTRGIMYADTKGTFLYNLLLPIVIFTPEQIKEVQEKELSEIK